MGGYITKYDNVNDVINKTTEIANLGYFAEYIDTCIYLSTGKKCAYGIKATVPYNTCESNPEMTFEWWNYDNNMDIISYLKSLGYECIGKSW